MKNLQADALLRAIDDYVRACGGDPVRAAKSATSIAQQESVLLALAEVVYSVELATSDAIMHEAEEELRKLTAGEILQ
jgi:hypothetical protein